MLQVMGMRVGARTLGSGLDTYALRPNSALRDPDHDEEDVNHNQVRSRPLTLLELPLLTRLAGVPSLP